jgi:hypothetical protein
MQPIHIARTAALIVGLLASGCTSAQKRPLVATALDDAEMRHESFEATLRVLDEHPDYVDEFFQLSLQHPRTLDRLLHATAHQLEQEDFARHAAERLTEAPQGLEMTLIASLDAMQDEPEAKAATARAIEQRPQATVAALVQRDRALRATIRALVEEIQHNPEAQRVFVVALEENSRGMAAVLTKHPDAMLTLLKAIGKSGLRNG